MTHTITYTKTLEVVECGNCCITFAMPQQMLRQVQEDGSFFWCPKGCKIHYFEDENSQLKKKAREAEEQLAAERARRDQAEAAAEHERRRANGYKGAAAKTKKRAARGVCPADGCKRSFVDVAKHVATCHPDLAAEVSE